MPVYSYLRINIILVWVYEYGVYVCMFSYHLIAGVQGPTGEPGPKGVKGVQGPTGERGAMLQSLFNTLHYFQSTAQIYFVQFVL